LFSHICIKCVGEDCVLRPAFESDPMLALGRAGERVSKPKLGAIATSLQLHARRSDHECIHSLCSTVYTAVTVCDHRHTLQARHFHMTGGCTLNTSTSRSISRSKLHEWSRSLTYSQQSAHPPSLLCSPSSRAR
jgi:hypothetical protein